MRRFWIGLIGVLAVSFGVLFGVYGMLGMGLVLFTVKSPFVVAVARLTLGRTRSAKADLDAAISV